MITNFEISKNRLKKVVPSWKVILTCFIIVNVSLFTALIRHYPYNLLIGEPIFLALAIALLSRKAERYVFRVSFDDETETCTVFYYQYQFFKFKKSIRYANLTFLYEKLQFTSLDWALTLRIKEENKMVVDIREKHNMGYTNDEIAAIVQKIKEIKEKKNDN